MRKDEYTRSRLFLEYRIWAWVQERGKGTTAVFVAALLWIALMVVVAITLLTKIVDSLFTLPM